MAATSSDTICVVATVHCPLSSKTLFSAGMAASVEGSRAAVVDTTKIAARSGTWDAMGVLCVTDAAGSIDELQAGVGVAARMQHGSSS